MEKLNVAHESTDLGEAEDGRLGDVDYLRAAGMIARRRPLAFAIMRVIEDRDRQSLRDAVEGMMAILAGLPSWNNSPQRLGRPTARDLDASVARVLSWMLDPLCPHCAGRGHAVIEGTPVLSDDPCEACEGTGRSKPVWSDAERDLYDIVQSILDEAEGAMRDKLRG